MQLADLLTPADILFGLRAADIGGAAADLLRQTLARRHLSASDITRLVAAVIDRERDAPTLCGAIAIPHARDAHLTSFLAAVGINQQGVIEGEPTPRIIVAFLSPESRRSEHLELLASLARLSRDDRLVEAIAAARDPQSVIDLLHSRQA